MLNPKTVLFLCFVCGDSVILAADETEITKVMKYFEIVPDLIDEVPKNFLNIAYDSDVIVNKGAELTPTQVKNEPKVEWKYEANALYTLIMTAPDALSPHEPILGEWNHWLIGNIPNSELSKGDVLSAYVGSAPAPGRGLHIFVFLLYKQPKKLDFAEPRLSANSSVGRENFSTRRFVKKYNLVVPPIAGNFFHAQYDNYVKQLYKQWGMQKNGTTNI